MAGHAVILLGLLVLQLHYPFGGVQSSEQGLWYGLPGASSLPIRWNDTGYMRLAGLIEEIKQPSPLLFLTVGGAGRFRWHHLPKMVVLSSGYKPKAASCTMVGVQITDSLMEGHARSYRV